MPLTKRKNLTAKSASRSRKISESGVNRWTKERLNSGDSGVCDSPSTSSEHEHEHEQSSPVITTSDHEQSSSVTMTSDHEQFSPVITTSDHEQSLSVTMTSDHEQSSPVTPELIIEQRTPIPDDPPTGARVKNFRIVYNLDTKLQKYGNGLLEHQQSCVFCGSLELTKEDQVGLISSLVYKCTKRSLGCSFSVIIRSADSEAPHQDTNDNVV
jgi:hypothetical protein